MRALLMATRGWDELEAEPIEIDTDDPQVVVLIDENGERLELDRGELEATMEAAA